MRNLFTRVVLSLGLLAVVVLVGYSILKTDTKSYSPEDTVNFEHQDLEFEVFYNRPYKKGREIFGALVPFEQVWRTGANEATTFETSEDLMVDGSYLPAGKYTLWTVPKKESWEIIFNSEMYPWGIDTEGNPSRIPDYDVLTVEVPVRKIKEPVEQFTIDFDPEKEFVELNLVWDETLIQVPIKNAPDSLTAERRS